MTKGTFFSLLSHGFEFVEAAKVYDHAAVPVQRTDEKGEWVRIVPRTISEDMEAADIPVKEIKRLYVTKDRVNTYSSKVHLAPVVNKDFIRPKVEYYSTGASNTIQRTVARFKFQLDYLTVILQTQYDSSGTYAISFSDYVDGWRDELEEMASEGDEAKNGIKFSEDDEKMVWVLSRDEYGQLDFIEIEFDELCNNLIGVEMVSYEMLIIPDEIAGQHKTFDEVKQFIKEREVAEKDEENGANEVSEEK